MNDSASPANAGVHYPPPLLYVGGIAAGWLAQRAHPLPITGHPSTVRTALAVAFALGWLGLFAAASGAFVRHRTTLIPNRPAAALVTSGVYRFTRNPMYLGLTWAYLGLSIVMNWAWPIVLLPVVLIVLTTAVIRREEAHLRAAFGAGYDEYCRQVRRWL